MAKKNEISARAKISLTKASNDIDGISTLLFNLAEPPNGSEFGATRSQAETRRNETREACRLDACVRRDRGVEITYPPNSTICW